MRARRKGRRRRLRYGARMLLHEQNDERRLRNRWSGDGWDLRHARYLEHLIVDFETKALFYKTDAVFEATLALK